MSHMPDRLQQIRNQFPILQTQTYLISHSLGAMPRKAIDYWQRFSRLWQEKGIAAWQEEWWALPVTVGNKIARIIGAPEGSVTMHQNVTLAEAVVLSCFNFRGPRRKIVFSSMNFPSVMYLYHAQRELGAEIVEVPAEPDGIRVSVEKLLDAIDERTLLVPISHVLFKSSYVQNVAAIVEKAERVGAWVVADIYQSAGVMPVNVAQWGVHFAVGGSVKWLCGGPGAGFLYVRPDLQESLRPKLTGWMAHENPFAFEPGAIRYADNAFRWLNGTPHVPALYSAQAGYDFILDVGIETIRDANLRLSEFIIEQAKARGWPVRCPENPEERGGTVILDLPRGEHVVERLMQRNIQVDYRSGAGIRIGPHVYNTQEDCEVLIAEIETILNA